MGDMPLMTDNGTFVINGTERVIVSQMHRSPGVFFDHDKGKTHSSGKYLFAARVIPYRGSWLDFEFDAKDLVYVRIDRRRKLPATTLLMALDSAETRSGARRERRPRARSWSRGGAGHDAEEILDYFYDKIDYTRDKKGWRTPFDAERLRGVKLTSDLIDAKTGKVVAEAGDKMTPRARQEARSRAASRKCSSGRGSGRQAMSPRTSSTRRPARSWPRPATRSPRRCWKLAERGVKELPILAIDHVNVGAYIRNTLAVDKNDQPRGRADRHLPGHASGRAADPGDGRGAVQRPVLRSGALRPVRGRPREDERAPRLRDRRHRARAAQARTSWRSSRPGRAEGRRGEIDDIDHLGNRRVRSVGELMENQYRIGLLRMERAIRERMSSVEIDTVMPHDLINAKPAAAAVREFFGSSQLSQFMDQTNPLSEITHKRRLSALGPGGLTRERAGFEVRDVHPTHYGRICPIETPEGPNIGLINSLATYARVNQYGFIESPVPQGRERQGDRRGGLPLGHGGGPLHHRPGQRRARRRRASFVRRSGLLPRRGGEYLVAPARRTST